MRHLNSSGNYCRLTQGRQADLPASHVCTYGRITVYVHETRLYTRVCTLCGRTERSSLLIPFSRSSFRPLLTCGRRERERERNHHHKRCQRHFHRRRRRRRLAIAYTCTLREKGCDEDSSDTAGLSTTRTRDIAIVLAIESDTRSIASARSRAPSAHALSPRVYTYSALSLALLLPLSICLLLSTYLSACTHRTREPTHCRGRRTYTAYSARLDRYSRGLFAIYTILPRRPLLSLSFAPIVTPALRVFSLCFFRLHAVCPPARPFPSLCFAK